MDMMTVLIIVLFQPQTKLSSINLEEGAHQVRMRMSDRNGDEGAHESLSGNRHRRHTTDCGAACQHILAPPFTPKF